MPETLAMGLAFGGYGLALAATLRRLERFTGIALLAALSLHTIALASRWQALGHGPFTTLYEILSSNLWSLALVTAVAWWLWREVRAALPAAWPVLVLLALWMLAADARPGHLPPTYATPLLYLHTLVGKLYLGLLLVALALAWRARREPSLGVLAHRFAAFAFVFDTLMLIVGAVWAQDAWGRYWAWDPLESWAFVSWLALAMALHARASTRPTPRVFAWWLTVVFVLAFLTFFGVPFLSTAPHQGAV